MGPLWCHHHLLLLRRRRQRRRHHHVRSLALRHRPRAPLVASRLDSMARLCVLPSCMCMYSMVHVYSLPPVLAAHPQHSRARRAARARVPQHRNKCIASFRVVALCVLRLPCLRLDVMLMVDVIVVCRRDSNCVIGSVSGLSSGASGRTRPRCTDRTTVGVRSKASKTGRFPVFCESKYFFLLFEARLPYL